MNIKLKAFLALTVLEIGLVSQAEAQNTSLISGTVVAWGDSSLTPVPQGLSNVVGISTAGDLVGSPDGGGWTPSAHGLALKTDGTVIAWGDNYGPNSAQYSGQSVVPAGLKDVVAIAAGGFYSMALKSDGTVVQWGVAPTAPTGLTNVVAIAAGGAEGPFGRGQNLALKLDGTVVGWPSAAPVGLSNVVAIAAAGGGYWTARGHCLALKSDGTVVAWGQIFDGTNYVAATVPVGLTGVVAIAAGVDHNLVLKSDGTVMGWGRNLNGECTPPVGLTNVVAIAAATDFNKNGGSEEIPAGRSLALRGDGTVVVWGATSPPTNSLTGVSAIAAGAFQTLALVAPPLSVVIQANGNSVLLSWLSSAQGLALQGTTNLSDQNSWTTLTNVPVSVGLQSRVTNTIVGPVKFYRLKK